jgi:murein DD-endopeptidase MepM/ murein hydrolase activator NlpD
LGIDYAAPTGTPVQAIGDGKIVYAGWREGFGKFVQIKHNSKYQSAYGHLRRYGRNIKKNRIVTQGQIIGFVGATGLATGPHLDFRLLNRGRFVNPLKINFPSAKPVHPKDLPDFKAKIKSMLSALNKSQP